jgi:HlyD family secretion protein
MKLSPLKLGIGLGLGILIMAIGSWYIWFRGEAEIKWRTAPIEQGDIQVSVTSTGSLQAVLTVLVGTQVSGTVAAIYVDFNSHVKKGQVVARIDTTLLKAAQADALANQEKAGALSKQASEELKRTQALFARTLVSQADLDQATANAHVATANLNSAKAQADRARINLKFATIVSPIDGIVLSRAVDVGQTVAASFNTPTLFTIAGDLRQMQVQASVDEADIGKIALRQKVTFAVDAYPDSTFEGQVQQIRLQPTTVQNVVTYIVIIDVPNPNLKLMPGMTANLTIVVAHKENVLLAPASALRFKLPPVKMNTSESKQEKSPQPAHRHDKVDGPDKVFVLENGKLKPIFVKTGLSDGTHTEITGSFNTGDTDSGALDSLPLSPGTLVVTGIEPSTSSIQNKASPFGMGKSSGGGAHGGGGGGGARYH